MAQYCPKCNYKLRIRDWRPDCPKCGVNVVYYGIEDRLREEADAAEYSHAKNQPKYDRLKFSLIGHPLSIVRLVLGILPIAATLLPMGTVQYALPFGTTNETVNLISIISFFSEYGLDFGLLTKLAGSQVIGKGITAFAAALIALVLCLLFTLVGFFMLTLSCAPKGFKRNIFFPSVGIVLSTAAFISYCVMINTLTAELPGIFTGTVNPAAYIAMIVVFAAIIAVNIIYKKKNIQVKYKDVSEFLLPYAKRPSTIEKQKAATENAGA